jgi:hypothetical protein
MSAQPATNPAKAMFRQQINAQLMREAKPSRLSFDDYCNSVVEAVKGTRYHVASSSRPSSVREVVKHSDGHLSCSCPARKQCVHMRAVEEFLAPIELTIAEPCKCCGCRLVDPNPAGCIFGGTASDHQAMNAIAA